MKDEDKDENKDEKNDIWLINIPILSISCPYSGRIMSGILPLAELVKGKCHHPMNTKWLLWTYPKCDKESCPIKVK
jgi:hypothetical protein